MGKDKTKPIGEDKEKIRRGLGERFKLPATKLRFINQTRDRDMIYKTQF